MELSKINILGIIWLAISAFTLILSSVFYFVDEDCRENPKFVKFLISDFIITFISGIMIVS